MKIRIALLLSLIMVSTSVCFARSKGAANNTVKKTALSQSFEIFALSQYPDKDYVPIAIHGAKLWGYANRDGRIAIDFQFDEVYPFAQNGLALVKKDNLFGYIRFDGSYAIKPQFLEAWDFGPNGLAPVRVNNKWGYIREDGSVAIAPIYINALCFAANGLAAVQLESSRRWGYIKQDGSFAITPRFVEAGNFAENGLAPIMERNRIGRDICGYIYQDGSIAFSNEEWTDVGDFSKNGLAPISNGRDKIGYVKDDGTLALPIDYYRNLSVYISHYGSRKPYNFSSNGLALVNYKWETFFIRSDGRRAFDGMYEHKYFDYCANGLAFVGKKIKTGDRYMSLGSFTRKVGEEFKTEYQVIDSDGNALLSVNENYPCKQGSGKIEAVVRSDGKVVWPLNLTAACRAKSAALAKAKQEETKRTQLQKISSTTTASSSSSSNNRITNVEIEVRKWDWEVKSFTVSGGPGKCDKWSNDKWHVKPFGKGVAGTYHWTATIGYGSKPDDTDIVCSGTFRLNGNEYIYKIKVYSDGSESTPYIYYYR
ncbi:WG repeat-containing protein [Chlorobaculum thiosulfatiphilum]|uniref:WG repeat-containing protein n=2 Tax=Chlorobaculum thiosulfatiphilum TaxID=115852 RepID=A0A5C4S5U3_CHLTI|nr:WG repeat-containing protein [Chlorobaculum thiosulfatiphilum]